MYNKQTCIIFFFFKYSFRYYILCLQLDIYIFLLHVCTKNKLFNDQNQFVILNKLQWVLLKFHTFPDFLIHIPSILYEIVYEISLLILLPSGWVSKGKCVGKEMHIFLKMCHMGVVKINWNTLVGCQKKIHPFPPPLVFQTRTAFTEISKNLSLLIIFIFQTFASMKFLIFFPHFLTLPDLASQFHISRLYTIEI